MDKKFGWLLLAVDYYSRQGYAACSSDLEVTT
jgi:hypothetical protein